MSVANFYVTVDNHFNLSPEEKAQARREEENQILEDMGIDIEPFTDQDYSFEGWDG